MLEKARAGIFSQFEVQRGLPIQLLVKHFRQIGELWQLNADIRAMVQHRQLNLMQDFSHLGSFDVIFCRNVLIYFDQDTKIGIFNRLARSLEADGVLALGAAESVVGITDAFKPFPERRGLYRPNPARGRASCAEDGGRGGVILPLPACGERSPRIVRCEAGEGDSRESELRGESPSPEASPHAGRGGRPRPARTLGSQ